MMLTSPSPAQRHRPDAVRLSGLDALRAIAAMCVVVMHVGAIWPGEPRRLSSAYLAVDFFFLLSGFVMARTYDARLKAGTLPSGRFLALRVRRLWPTMLVGALLALPFLWRDNPLVPVFVLAALPNLLLLPSFVTAELFPLNTPAWSIFFELVANAVHAVLGHRMAMPALALMIAVLAALLMVTGAVSGNLDVGSRAANMGGGFVRVGASYGLGVLLWRWHGDRPPLAVPPALALVAMPVLFAAADRLGLNGWQFDMVFVLVVSPLLLWGGLGATGRLPASTERACLVAGALSFPLYAVHYPVLLAAESLGLAAWAAPLVAIAAAWATAWQLGGLDHIKMTHRKPQVTF